MTVKQLTGWRNRINGQKFEIKVHNRLRSRKGCLASCRSSGSYGMFDIWAMFENKTCVAMCKGNGYLTPKERREFKEWWAKKPKHVQLEFWYYTSPKKMKKEVIRNANHFER